MRKTRFSEGQIINVLKGVEAGQRVADACRAHGISEQTYHRCKARYAGKAVDQWAARGGVNLRFIDPGKPMRNGYIESFNGKFRDECLSRHWLISLEEARSVSETWRIDYNERRVPLWSCSITLSRYLRRRGLQPRGGTFSFTDAVGAPVYEACSSVPVVNGSLRRSALVNLLKDRFAAEASRLALSMNSIV